MNHFKIGKIGDRLDNPRPSMFELCVLEHVPLLDPKKFGLEGEIFNAHRYFITSGDAVSKARILVRDLKQLKADMAAIHNLNNPTWDTAIGDRVQRAEHLLELLIEARGTSIFLESEYNDRRLWVIPKNPRSKLVDE